MNEIDYDVVIVGSGIAGAILALELGKVGHRVLILEAGEALPHGREKFFERYLLDTSKFPEAPYGDNPNAPKAKVSDLRFHLKGGWKDAKYTYLDQSDSETAFGSTYERQGGGTMWHWMGTSLRLLPSDFEMQRVFKQGVNWPITYDELAIVSRRPDGKSYYDLAEYEIGVSASVADQPSDAWASRYRQGYEYPNPPIPLSRVDRFFERGLAGMTIDSGSGPAPVGVISTPAGRNSRPFDNRRACAGNTNCVPICPIEAKYDPTVTLHKAFSYPNVCARFRHVATKLERDDAGRQITGVHYVTYSDPTRKSPAASGVVRARTYVVAANGIETPKLLLLSGMGEVNPSIGRNLMDHPFYLRWGLAKSEQVFPYRGPLSTAGIDTWREGRFRDTRAAFRIEIGNDGWALPKGDPYATLLDHIDGTNHSGTNREGEAPQRLMGADLVRKVNGIYTRQCRIGFELEQLPNSANRVELSHYEDDLGIKRPKIFYSLSDYERRGLKAAAELSAKVFERCGIEDFTSKISSLEDSPFSAKYEDAFYSLMGAGHVMGTYCMGDDPKKSVVNKYQRSWEYENLYLLGSGVFPTGGTANPTLTIAALSFWAADTIKQALKRSGMPA